LQTVRAGKTLRLQPTNLTYVEFVWEWKVVCHSKIKQQKQY
jgi:hypothetical protein